MMRKETLILADAAAPAFLGAQHNEPMLPSLDVGLGGAGLSVMTEVPVPQAAMPLLPAAMGMAIACRISKLGSPAATPATGAMSDVGALGFAAWPVLRCGL